MFLFKPFAAGEWMSFKLAFIYFGHVCSRSLHWCGTRRTLRNSVWSTSKELSEHTHPQTGTCLLCFLCMYKPSDRNVMWRRSRELLVHTAVQADDIYVTMNRISKVVCVC